MGVRSYAGIECMAYQFEALNARNKVTEQYFILARDAEKIARQVYELEEELAALRTKHHRLTTAAMEFATVAHTWPWLNERVFNAAWALIRHLLPAAPRNIQR